MLIHLLLIRFEKLERRSKMEICSRFRKEVFSLYYRKSPYPDQNGSCTQLTYDKETDDNRALTELNYMRWLVGFDTKTVITNEYDDHLIQCAINNVANENLEHYIGGNDNCYTNKAASGCATSSLSAYRGRGYNAAIALQHFIEDSGEGNEDVIHRKWVLFSGLKKTAFGGAYNSKAPKYSTTIAMKTLFRPYEMGEKLLFTAYPPPGYFPAQFVYNRFSFWAPNIPDRSFINISVKINDVPQNITERTDFLQGAGDQDKGVVFSLSDYGVNSYDYPYETILNKRIDVKISYDKTVFDYTIYPVDCSVVPVRTSVPDSDSYYSSNGSSDSTKKKVSIGVGVSLAIVLIIVVAFVCYFIFYKKNNDNGESNNDENQLEDA
ncbi:hypothetical protein TVAG_294790 [Trichomonas vaginalis G3]|uniref:SCP domain-containing protein n=1 Tax=Trichomonas vaginalis (strain ATCC PRA-98 / G3) TaxID=412133 RepID=A2DL37_TRIV3|nr:DNA-directed 5'-3' RNA polymerase protein [Trichomonas vaginalis G3]EAY18828.1 hypothetical protein TVAG_294790 [Trichomonas vaginalis G3]KAI5526066.1 DNA-directed 5'-3' RNA polymerase protein [Trichomonas vaginalis G3]|eukprot:XP_001579814.1 hypothetical protein [Trichomonas vaginalis G3]